VLGEARRQGASAAACALSRSQGLSVTVRLGEPETVEHLRDRSLGVTVFFGQRSGSASTSDFRPEAIRESVRAACTIARYTGEDPAAGLADPERLATAFPDLDLYHPWDVSVEQLIGIARECEAAGREADPRIANTEGGSVNTHEAIDVYANSHGFLGAVRSTRHGLSCSLIARDEAGMQRDYWYDSARNCGDLLSPVEIGRRAAARTAARLGARQIGTRRCPVLYEAPVAGSLISHFVGAVRGSSLYRRASFLLDQIGQPVFAPHVRLHEQPHLPRASGSTVFDDEGVATAPRDLVAGGILQGYVLDSYAARKLGMRTTGNAGGVHNLTAESGALDFQGLLAEMGTGLLVTELIGFGVNTVTGDYSRGAAGFWVEGGEIAYPVEEITVGGNLRELYRSIREIGTDVDTRGNLRTGSILLDELTVAGA
jgi:PmbA protein